MPASTLHHPGHSALRHRPALALAGALALLVTWTGGPARADETAPSPEPPFVRPLPGYVPPPLLPVAMPAVPEDVRAAVSSLAQACAAWSSPANDSLPVLDGGYPRFVERDVCDVMTSPRRFLSHLLWFGGALGAAAIVLGLMGFCALRAVLVSLWNWRPRSVAGLR